MTHPQDRDDDNPLRRGDRPTSPGLRRGYEARRSEADDPPEVHATSNRGTPATLGLEVRSIIRAHACSTAHCDDLAGDLLLGTGGLGLDSVAVVELLISCEERFGVALAATLLDGPPLDVGTLVAQIDRAQRAR